MAHENWQSNQHIVAASRVAKTFGDTAVILIEFKGGSFQVVSYGKDAPTCAAAGKVVDVIAAMLQSGGIEIPEEMSQ